MSIAWQAVEDDIQFLARIIPAMLVLVSYRKHRKFCGLLSVSLLPPPSPAKELIPKR